MTWWQAAILGIVEGLTEYLPVSSTGHLLVVQALLGIGVESADAKEAADAYAICIQAGAILAVLGLYFARVKQMGNGLLGRDDAGRRMAINVMLGFMPAAIIGLALNDLIKSYLFGMWPVITAWFVGGVAILVVARWRAARQSKDAGDGTAPTNQAMSLDMMTARMALLIGLIQCIAMWPGVSRSLVTIVGGIAVGLSLAAAVEFSFLLGVITLGAATVYDGMKHGRSMTHYYDPMEMIIGFVLAFVSAIIAVKWMVAYLKSHGMEIFGYYRIAIAIVVGVLVAMGIIADA